MNGINRAFETNPGTSFDVVTSARCKMGRGVVLVLHYLYRRRRQKHASSQELLVLFEELKSIRRVSEWKMST